MPYEEVKLSLRIVYFLVAIPYSTRWPTASYAHLTWVTNRTDGMDNVPNMCVQEASALNQALWVGCFRALTWYAPYESAVPSAEPVLWTAFYTTRMRRNPSDVAREHDVFCAPRHGSQNDVTRMMGAWSPPAMCDDANNTHVLYSSVHFTNQLLYGS